MESCVQSHLDLEQGQIHFDISKRVCALKDFFFLILQSESAFNGATLTMGLGKRETHESVTAAMMSANDSKVHGCEGGI